jgi:hypothetical protein
LSIQISSGRKQRLEQGIRGNGSQQGGPVVLRGREDRRKRLSPESAVLGEDLFFCRARRRRSRRSTHRRHGRRRLHRRIHRSLPVTGTARSAEDHHSPRDHENPPERPGHAAHCRTRDLPYGRPRYRPVDNWVTARGR